MRLTVFAVMTGVDLVSCDLGRCKPGAPAVGSSWDAKPFSESIAVASLGLGESGALVVDFLRDGVGEAASDSDLRAEGLAGRGEERRESGLFLFDRIDGSNMKRGKLDGLWPSEKFGVGAVRLGEFEVEEERACVSRLGMYCRGDDSSAGIRVAGSDPNTSSSMSCWAAGSSFVEEDEDPVRDFGACGAGSDFLTIPSTCSPSVVGFPVLPLASLRLTGLDTGSAVVAS